LKRREERGDCNLLSPFYLARGIVQIGEDSQGE